MQTWGQPEFDRFLAERSVTDLLALRDGMLAAQAAPAETATCVSKAVISNTALTTPELERLPRTTAGYFSRNHADSAPE